MMPALNSQKPFDNFDNVEIVHNTVASIYVAVFVLFCLFAFTKMTADESQVKTKKKCLVVVTRPTTQNCLVSTFFNLDVS